MEICKIGKPDVSTPIPPAFDEKQTGKLWSTNNKVEHVSLEPPKSTFSEDHISEHRHL